MNRTLSDDGRRDDAFRRCVKLLRQRFGPISSIALNELRQRTDEELERLVDLSLSARSLRELGLDD